MESSVTLW
jgi:hypothetical protein